MAWMVESLVDSFLQNSFLPIYGITLVFAMIRYHRYFDTSLKYFPVLILYTLLNELLGVLVGKYDYFSFAFNNLYNEVNIIIYNIYDIVFFLYFYYLFWCYISKLVYRNLIKYAAMVFLIAVVINIFSQSFLLVHQQLTYFIGSIILIGCIIMYLQQISKNLNTKPLRKDILYWISIGLLVFHLGYIPIKIFRYYYLLEGQENPNIRRIHLFLVLIMYTCFIIGFIRMKGKFSKKQLIENFNKKQ